MRDKESGRREGKGEKKEGEEGKERRKEGWKEDKDSLSSFQLLCAIINNLILFYCN